MLLGHESGLCVGDPLQREGIGHDGGDAPALDVIDQIGEHLGLQDRASEEAQVLQIERSHVEFDQRPADRARHGVASSGAERFEQFRPLPSRDQVDHDIDAVPPERVDNTVVTGERSLGSEAEHLRRLGGTGHGDDPSPTRLGQLNRRGADTARRAGNENAIPRPDPRPGQEVLRRGVGTRKRGELDVAERALDPVGVPRRNHGVLGKSSVAFRAEIPGSLQLLPVGFAEARLDQDPLTDPIGVDLFANRNDPSADVGALDARKVKGRTGPARVFAGAVLLRIPGRPGVDIRIVDGRRGHPNEHVAPARTGNREVVADLEPIEPAVPGEPHAAHRPRLFTHPMSPLVGFPIISPRAASRAKLQIVDMTPRTIAGLARQR